jgi:hypothetical protein
MVSPMIKMFDRQSIDQLEWPDTEEGKLARLHLLPLMKEGTESFIKNAKTELYIIQLDHLIIPCTVNHTDYQNCYLLSAYFIAANLVEKLEKMASWKGLLLKPLVNLFGVFLKIMKINKVVIINNWLFTTNPYPELTAPQIKAITEALKQHFPDHYYMFRSVNTYKSSQVYDALNFEKFRMIPCRTIYLYDPQRTSKLSSSVLRKQKKDTNRLENKHYYVEPANSLTDEEMKRVLELYQNIYVKKYTKYSPLYTEKYLSRILENETYQLKLLKKENIIYGVVGFLQKNGFLLVPFFGYDTSVPQEEGLYRMLSAIIMQEIGVRKVVSHQGSGAGQFKKWRGFTEEMEYIGIYDKHLPFFRRLFWSLSQKFSSRLLHYVSQECEAH